MTDRKWKVGDRVKCGGSSTATITGAPSDAIPYWVIKHEDGSIGWANADEMQYAGSELDAIERDFKDLFARMRAEIERLK